MINIDKVVENLVNVLFRSELERLDEKVMDLNTKNNQIRKRDSFGFRLSGDIFIPKAYSNITRHVKKDYPTLSFELFHEGNEFIRCMHKINNDMLDIRQIFVKLLMDTKSTQDIRDALPESMVNMLPDHYKGLQRTRPEAWTIMNNPRAMRQYMKLQAKIDMYSIIGMMY